MSRSGSTRPSRHGRSLRVAHGMLDQRPWDGPAGCWAVKTAASASRGAVAEACACGPVRLQRRTLAGLQWVRQRADAVARRWRRLVLRDRAWQAWARAGVHLAVAQRPRLRRSPLPWLFCVVIGDDLRQTWPGTTRELVAELAVLAELMELHTAPYAAVPYVAAPDVAGHRPTGG